VADLAQQESRMEVKQKANIRERQKRETLRQTPLFVATGSINSMFFRIYNVEALGQSSWTSPAAPILLCTPGPFRETLWLGASMSLENS
jgi:hypothetical protein